MRKMMRKILGDVHGRGELAVDVQKAPKALLDMTGTGYKSHCGDALRR